MSNFANFCEKFSSLSDKEFIEQLSDSEIFNSIIAYSNDKDTTPPNNIREIWGKFLSILNNKKMLKRVCSNYPLMLAYVPILFRDCWKLADAKTKDTIWSAIIKTPEILVAVIDKCDNADIIKALALEKVEIARLIFKNIKKNQDKEITENKYLEILELSECQAVAQSDLHPDDLELHYLISLTQKPDPANKWLDHFISFDRSEKQIQEYIAYLWQNAQIFFPKLTKNQIAMIQTFLQCDVFAKNSMELQNQFYASLIKYNPQALSALCSVVGSNKEEGAQSDFDILNETDQSDDNEMPFYQSPKKFNGKTPTSSTKKTRASFSAKKNSLDSDSEDDMSFKQSPKKWSPNSLINSTEKRQRAELMEHSIDIYAAPRSFLYGDNGKKPRANLDLALFIITEPTIFGPAFSNNKTALDNYLDVAIHKLYPVKTHKPKKTETQDIVMGYIDSLFQGLKKLFMKCFSCPDQTELKFDDPETDVTVFDRQSNHPGSINSIKDDYVANKTQGTNSNNQTQVDIQSQVIGSNNQTQAGNYSSAQFTNMKKSGKHLSRRKGVDQNKVKSAHKNFNLSIENAVSQQSAETNKENPSKGDIANNLRAKNQNKFVDTPRKKVLSDINTQSGVQNNKPSNKNRISSANDDKENKEYTHQSQLVV